MKKNSFPEGFYLSGSPWQIRTTLRRLAKTPLTVQQYLQWKPFLPMKKHHTPHFILSSFKRPTSKS